MSKLILICVVLFVSKSYGASTFGYHLRVGVPAAFELFKYEGHSRIIGGSQVTSATAIPHQVSKNIILLGRVKISLRLKCSSNVLLSTAGARPNINTWAHAYILH